MRTADFSYVLPPERIAQEPLPERDRSRMMVLRRESGEIEHSTVDQLPRFLGPGDLVVANDTRVFPARVFGHRRDTRGKIEVLFVEEVSAGLWKALCRTKSRLPPGTPLSLANDEIRAEVVERKEDGATLLRVSSKRPVMDVLESEGVAPLPPYIKRPKTPTPDGQRDRLRYQTVYASRTGAVAAPTAGLHFTPTLLSELERKGVGMTTVTLHVGPGTFRPVKAERVEDHVVELEQYRISETAAGAIQGARDGGRRVVAVGTTTVRVLETVAAERGRIVACEGRTSLFIYPPYAFRVVGALLTNFHLPMSSLLMMVSAFAAAQAEPADSECGRQRLLAAYRQAIEGQYRFYSYGDCMLLL